MKKNIIKSKVVILIIAVFILIISSFASFEFSQSNNKFLINYETEAETLNYIENIENETEIKQQFYSKYNNLQIIEIGFNTLNNENLYGEAKIILKEVETDKIIAQEDILYNNIRDKQKYKVKFKKQADSQDKLYEISVKFIEDKQQEKVFTINYDNNSENTFYINNVEQKGSLDITEYYSSKYRTIFYYVVLSIISIIFLGISYYIYMNKNITVEKAFLFTVPVICILFMLFMPPMKNHDELYHWYRICDIANGNPIAQFPNEEIPFTAANIQKNQINILNGKDWLTLKYKDVYELYKNNDSNTQLDYTDISTSAVYSPVQYLPQSIGVLISNIFTDNVIIVTYFARLFNLIFSIIVLYLAIKIIPFGKKILLIASYIPIAIEGFTSMSPDAITISISFLFIAYVLNLAFSSSKKIITKKEKIILKVLSSIIALCKIVYVPIVLLMFIIPVEKFKNKKDKIISFITIAGIAAMLNLVWLYIASKYLVEFRGGDSKLQLIYILKNPLEFLNIIIYTINVRGYSYIDSLFGGQLGWGELIRLNFIVPFTLFVLLIGLGVVDNKIKNKFKTYQICTIGIIVLAIIGLVFTSLYIQWTSVGNNEILGVQGRYFLPIIPLIVFCLGKLKIKNEYEETNIIKFISIIGMILQLYTILCLVQVHL